MTFEIVGPEAGKYLDWTLASDAIADGHDLPKAQIRDSFLYRGRDTLLTRSAWIDGLGLLVKPVLVFADNPARGVPMVMGSVNLFDDTTGALAAIVDYHLVTRWKTAADSLLSARRLARRDSRDFLIVGAGNVARSMIDAYSTAFPGARFTVWNRSPAAAEELAKERPFVTVTADLAQAVSRADVIATTTMSKEPLICGEWLRPGQHLDLIGAYRPDLREADDEVLRRARLFVDSRATTLDHIGELKIPLAAGVITPESVIADFYDLNSGAYTRRSDDEITVAKNGGGAHLDLIMASHILRRWRDARA